MALAIAIWTRDKAIFSSIRNGKMNKIMILACVKDSKDLDTRVTGMVGYKPEPSRPKPDKRSYYLSCFRG
jgi:hypothetical protein